LGATLAKGWRVVPANVRDLGHQSNFFDALALAGRFGRGPSWAAKGEKSPKAFVFQRKKAIFAALTREGEALP